MSLTNSAGSYGAVTKTFHWLTALLIFSAIPLGLIANDLADQIRDPDIIVSNDDIIRTIWLFSLHKTVGVSIFLVALARIVWAIGQPKPGLLNADNRLEATLAETVHWLLYGALVLVPLSGWASHSATIGFAPIWWPFGQDLPFIPKSQSLADSLGDVHVVLQKVLFAAIALHIIGALKHHFVDRDSTLRRMLPGQNDAPLPTQPHRSSLPLLAALAIWIAALAIGTVLGFAGNDTGLATSPATPPQRADLNRQPDQTGSDWVVSDGTLGLRLTQMGSEITGSFANWDAAITFDEPDSPGPAGSVEVTIDIASLSLGSLTQQAMGADFFDADRYATATFTGNILKTEAGYVATGPLTIRDITVPITLPFALDITGDAATMSASANINRMDFSIGASIPTEDAIAFGVTVTIQLNAARSTAQTPASTDS